MTKMIYAVDDDAEIRTSLYRLLCDVPGTAVRCYSSGAAFVEDLPELEPGVLLLDLRMPGIDGLDVLRSVTDAKSFSTIVLTGYASTSVAVDAMKAGAADLIEKPFAPDELLGRISDAEAARRREAARAESVAEAQARIERLSPRENDVLAGLIAGHANKRIAFDLGISARTVEIYRANLLSKLGVHTLAEVLHIAFCAGLPEERTDPDRRDLSRAHPGKNGARQLRRDNQICATERTCRLTPCRKHADMTGEFSDILPYFP